MSRFKDLKVWQKAILHVTKIYTETASFPREEIYGIPSNIAEGTGRRTKKDFSHFLDIAKGSSFELETQLIISRKLGFIKLVSFELLITELDEIQKMITGLQKSLTNS